MHRGFSAEGLLLFREKQICRLSFLFPTFGRCLFIILLEQFYAWVQIGFIEMKMSFLGLEMCDGSDLLQLGASCIVSHGIYYRWVHHSLIIIREVLILTVSIFIAPRDVFLDIHFNRML